MQEQSQNSIEVAKALMDLIKRYGDISYTTLDEILEAAVDDPELEKTTDQLTMAISCYMKHQETFDELDLEKSLLFLRAVETFVKRHIH